MKPLTLVNLTPHPINVHLPNQVIEIPPSGKEARVQAVTGTAECLVTTNGIVPIVKRTWGEVEGLPEPQRDTWFIVSSLVLSRVQARTDCIAPDTGPNSVIRDDEGRIIGVRQFVTEV